MKVSTQNTHPHQGQRIYTLGKPLAAAKAAMILIHGRGATAESILELAPLLPHPNLAYLAPQAAGNAWYPNRFIAPIASNEPFLSSALQTIDDLLTAVAQAGIPAEKVILGGFSQGACLAAQFVARTPQRYGGLLVFSGGLIGPPGGLPVYTGDLQETPVFIGCSNVDFHIPEERVHETAAILAQLGGSVNKRIYPNMEHTIIQDELDEAQRIVDAIL